MRLAASGAEHPFAAGGGSPSGRWPRRRAISRNVPFLTRALGRQGFRGQPRVEREGLVANASGSRSPERANCTDRFRGSYECTPLLSGSDRGAESLALTQRTLRTDHLTNRSIVQFPHSADAAPRLRETACSRACGARRRPTWPWWTRIPATSWDPTNAWSSRRLSGRKARDHDGHPPGRLAGQLRRLRRWRAFCTATGTNPRRRRTRRRRLPSRPMHANPTAERDGVCSWSERPPNARSWQVTNPGWWRLLDTSFRSALRDEEW